MPVPPEPPLRPPAAKNRETPVFRPAQPPRPLQAKPALPPPVYRPQQAPQPLQPKGRIATPPAPVPPVYRPQQSPQPLQKKSGTAPPPAPKIQSQSVVLTTTPSARLSLAAAAKGLPLQARSMLEFKRVPNPVGGAIQRAAAKVEPAPKPAPKKKKGKAPVPKWKLEIAARQAAGPKASAPPAAESEDEKKARIAAKQAEKKLIKAAKGGGVIKHVNKASEYKAVARETLDEKVRGVIDGGHDTNAEDHTTDPETGQPKADGVSVREYAPLGKGSKIRLVSRKQGAVTTWYYCDEHTLVGRNYQYHTVT